MAQAICRSQFTHHDLEFVVDKLSATPRGPGALHRLCQDPEALNQILDLEPLHRALIDTPQCTTVSPAFYFYVLTRRELLRRGLDDRNLCDYIAGVLTEFTRRDALDKAGGTESRRTFAYVSDLLQTIERAPSAQVFGLRRFLADYALFLSGLFKDNIEARRQRGAPGVGFYETVGSQSYHSAAAQPQALQEDLREVLNQVGDAFHDIRLALNALTDHALHFEKAPAIVTEF